MNARIESVFTHRKIWATLTLACAAMCLLTPPAGAVERQTLRGHVPAAVARLAPVDRLPASHSLNLAIGLPLRNPEALTNLLRELYNPSSSQFHQFLTPQQFAEHFGPSTEDYQALSDFVTAQGLQVTATHLNRAVLSVRGSAAQVEKAFHVTLRLYQHPTETRKFYAPDAEPSLDLAVPVLHISGLDDYSLPHPMSVSKPLNQGPSAEPDAGSAPGGAYMGDDFRAAYVPGTLLSGAGQTVGLLQFDAFYQSDITAYETLTGRRNVPLIVVPVDGGVGTPGFGNPEVSLDIEMVMSMAPGISTIYVYEAPNPSPWVDILSRMANDNLSKQLSCSWGGGPPDPAGDQIFLQMAVQGQSFFNACGDSDAFVGAIPFPAESPYIMQVGGTTLTTAGPVGAYQSEKVWNWGFGVGTCGGISPTYPIPSWQMGIDMTTNQGSTTMRNIPDVALTADNVYVLYGNGASGVFGGTSCAAPLWAGFTSLINQQAFAGALPPVGFLNPALYNIGKHALYTTCFHDITVGDNTWSGSPNLFFAVPGYDLCTGWGTPNGTNLINALASPVSGPSLVVVSNIVFGGNGNGLIDYNECNSLNLVLDNGGTAPATGVTVTLFTTNANVAIAQSTSAYPDIPAGGSATNLVPFKISTSPLFVCGTPVNFSVLAQYDQGASAYQFSLPSGVPGSPLRYDNNTVAVIPSPGFTNSSVVVSNINSAVNKVTVSLFVTEDIDYYLTLELIAPDGTTNILSANNGITGGQNYGLSCADSQRTTFDDAASTPIASAPPPFAGTFRPTQPLAIFSGKSGTNVNGVWQLRATDEGVLDTAAIQCWSLFITPTLCTDGGGQCPGADMALGMIPQPAVVMAGNNLTFSMAVTNLGPSATTNVVVAQLLPPNATFVSASASQGTYVQSGNVVSFSLGPMAARGTASLSTVVQPSDQGTNYTIYSTANVSSEQPDFNEANNTAVTRSIVTPAQADLAVGLSAAPNPALVGGTLTYTVSVTNNGPSSASSVAVTNVLPTSTHIQSVTVSQGTTTTLGNVILWSLTNKLAMGASATATITVTPTAQGQITATVSAGAREFDPLPANNTASLTTSVGPAADLAISIADYPDPVVAGGNVTYQIVVTNQGPSTATSVIVNDVLPAPVILVSTNPSQGTVALTNGALAWTIGTLGNTAKATLTLVVTTITNGTLTTSASVAATEADPNLANNNATATTRVTAPFITIVPDTVTLTYESGPVNGAIDIGETVTVILRLRNTGNVATSNLVATLLATNGVNPVLPNAPQSYGVIAPSGYPVGRSFTFVASGTNGQTISAVLQLHDGATTYSNVSFSFTLPYTQVFANTNVILIPDPAAQSPPLSYLLDSGPAKPYPAAITVSNFSGTLGNVSVTLSNVNHSYSGDINALLVAPGGANVLFMSHVGGQPVTNLDVTFDDSAASTLPDPTTGAIYSGTWQPSVYEPAPQLGGFPSNAPAGPYPTLLSAFNNTNPNGAWSLYIFDDASGDSGAVSNGWSLAVTRITPVNQLADLGLTGVAAPNPGRIGGTVTYLFTVTNAGPNPATSVIFTNQLPAGLTLLSASPSQGTVTAIASNSVTISLDTLGANAIAQITNVVMVTGLAIPNPAVTNAPLTNVASVTASETDLNPVNNTASVVTTNSRPAATLGWALAVGSTSVAVGYPLTNTVAITNLGPDSAFNTVLTEPLPPSFGFVAASSSPTATLVGTNIICSLGDFASNATASVVIVVASASAGSFTNQVLLRSDSYPTLYSNSYVATITNPAPQIVSAGAVLTYESGPRNGVVDPGETVTLTLLLANVGSANTVNLQATLQPTGNVTTNQTGPQSQSYGLLIPGGPSVGRSFTFKAATNLSGGAVVATLQLQDSTSVNPSVAFTFPALATTNFANSALITIPDHGTASPYPATINVSGLSWPGKQGHCDFERLRSPVPA